MVTKIYQFILILILFWIFTRLKYPFQLCYCSQFVVGDTFYITTLCDILWEIIKSSLMHLLIRISFKNCPYIQWAIMLWLICINFLKISINLANRFIYIFIYVYIATMWQHRYLLFTLALHYQFHIAYSLNALFALMSIHLILSTLFPNVFYIADMQCSR